MEIIVKDLCDYIIDNIYNEITLEKLEKEFYYSKYYLVRIFKFYTGYTIKEFINTVKVLKSINPLIYTNDTILKIALTHGFNSQEYYSEKFQEVIGVSPIRFRKEYSEIDETEDIKELKAKKEYLLYLEECHKQLLEPNEPIDTFDKVKKLSL